MLKASYVLSANTNVVSKLVPIILLGPVGLNRINVFVDGYRDIYISANGCTTPVTRDI